MKKYALFLLPALILFSCKKDENTTTILMRINHFQQPVDLQEFYHGLSLVVQEGKEIGTDKWNCLYNNISGFDFELGYVCDIEVEKKEISNPMIDSPGVEYRLIRVYAKNRVSQETSFSIVLSQKYFNGFKSYITYGTSSNPKLFNQINIDCGNFCEELSTNLDAQKSITGSFKHLDANTIKLIGLKVE